MITLAKITFIFHNFTAKRKRSNSDHGKSILQELGSGSDSGKLEIFTMINNAFHFTLGKHERITNTVLEFQL